MVPKVYLSPKDVMVQNGSVISGNNVQLAGGSVTNSGSSLLAQNGLTIDSSNSLNNLNAGLIKAGGGLDLSALGDINNIGSAMSGKTVQLESTGGSINNITQTQQWSVGDDSRRGSVHISGTDIGQTASISASDGLTMAAANDINITGAKVSAGGDLAMGAGNDINIAANQITASSSRSGFWRQKDTASSSTSNQGSSITAGGNAVMQADSDLNVTASSIDAGKTAQLVAGNDLNLNAAGNGQTSRTGGSESHQSSADRTTVSAGDNVMLVAGRDVTSQASVIVAGNNVTAQAGRDVNLLAEAATQGDSYRSKKKTEINETVRQTGGDIVSGGDTIIFAGRDVTAEAASVVAGGDIALNAGRDVMLTTATESDYLYREKKKTSGGTFSKKSTHTITEESRTREKGTLLSGDSVSVTTGNDLKVKGSSVVADRDIALSAGNNVEITAATNTDTSWHFKETKKSGLMSSGGIGVTIGTSKTTHDRREAGTTQSQSASTIGSTTGNVSITAGGQAHIVGSDVIAGNNIGITGDSVTIEPGHDKRTVDDTYKQKTTGVSVALSGTVGNALNQAVSGIQELQDSSDSRLAALQGVKVALSGVQGAMGYQQAQSSSEPQNAVGVSVSLTHQQSKSEQHYEHDIVSGTGVNAGNNVSITATGKNNGANSGDIIMAGSQVKAGNDLSLDAQNDILLSAAANRQKSTGKSSSSGGSLGASISGGANSVGLSVVASITGSKGSEKGNGTGWTETTLDAGNSVSITSGRDTALIGAQVGGEKVTANVGNNLTITSLQDSERYDSKQTSASAGGSVTIIGAGGGSGYASISQDKMTSNYDSVQEQSGIFAGKGGFDVTVGNHTQLDGAVIASTAAAENNSLDTGTLGWTSIHNEAGYSVSHTGISASMSPGMSTNSAIMANVLANASNVLTGIGGSKGHAEGTTSSAISNGSLIIRDQANQRQDVNELSREPEGANGSVGQIFDREKEQQRLQEMQLVSQITGQMSDIVMTYGEMEALKAARENGNNAGLSDEQLRETADYREAMKLYGTGSTTQMVVQAIGGVLGGLSADNLGQALAGGLNPAVAQLIKRQTGDNDSANLMAHAVWGALSAQLGGNNALAGAAGAFSGELAAKYIVDNYYGGSTADLSEKQRQEISMLATIAAGIAGGLAGDSTAAAGTGALAGKNSVENNYLSSKQVDAWSAEMKQCQAGGGDCSGIITKYEELSTAQQKQLISDCASSPATCQQKYGDVLADSMAVKQAIDRAMGEDIPIKMVYDLTATWAHQMDADGIVASNKVSEQIMAKYGLDQAQADIIAGVALSALGGVSKAGKGSGTSANSVTKPSINQGQQNKHVPGTNEYKIASEAGLNKSIITVQPDTLLSKLGTGQQVGKTAVGTPGSKERINYGTVIGNYIDPQTGVSTPTTNGIVHYGKNGVHIVPARPTE